MANYYIYLILRYQNFHKFDHVCHLPELLWQRNWWHWHPCPGNAIRPHIGELCMHRVCCEYVICIIALTQLISRISPGRVDPLSPLWAMSAASLLLQLTRFNQQGSWAEIYQRNLLCVVHGDPSPNQIGSTASLQEHSRPTRGTERCSTPALMTTFLMSPSACHLSVEERHHTVKQRLWWSFPLTVMLTFMTFSVSESTGKLVYIYG